MRGARRRLFGGTRLTVTAALMLGARGSMAQYPLAPSPVLNPELFSREPLLSGYLSVRETIRTDPSTFAVDRARITLQIIPTEFVVLRIQSDLAALGRATGDTVPGFELTDAYVQLSPSNSWRRPAGIVPALIIGQFRTPFSLEYLTPFSLLQTADRSQVVNRVATKRDIGVMVHLAFSDRATLAGGLVNGEGPNSIRNVNGKQLCGGTPDVISGDRSCRGGQVGRRRRRPSMGIRCAVDDARIQSRGRAGSSDARRSTAQRPSARPAIICLHRTEYAGMCSWS